MGVMSPPALRSLISGLLPPGLLGTATHQEEGIEPDLIKHSLHDHKFTGASSSGLMPHGLRRDRTHRRADKINLSPWPKEWLFSWENDICPGNVSLAPGLRSWAYVGT